MKGLKDHEVQELINAVRDSVAAKLPNCPQCLREIISGAIVPYLESKDLRIDK